MYAYRELQHVEALGLASASDLAGMLEDGELDPGGDLPVNVSGGSLGQGNLFEANGLVRLLECVEQLRGEAGERQVDETYVAVAQSTRAVPSHLGRGRRARERRGGRRMNLGGVDHVWFWVTDMDRAVDLLPRRRGARGA